jgi:hypothetical protein
MSIRYFHFVFALVALSAVQLKSLPLLAQTDSSTNHYSLAEGSWAVQFSVSDNFSLQSFRGSLLSAKYHLSPRTAIRVGLSADLRASEESNQSGYRSSYDNQDIRLVSHYLFYSNLDKAVVLFWGGGPEIGFYRYHTERVSQYSGETLSSSSQSFNAGISACAGAEWFASTWLSLHAEYGLTARSLRALSMGLRRTGLSVPPQCDWD